MSTKGEYDGLEKNEDLFLPASHPQKTELQKYGSVFALLGDTASARDEAAPNSTSGSGYKSLKYMSLLSELSVIRGDICNYQCTGSVKKEYDQKKW